MPIKHPGTRLEKIRQFIKTAFAAVFDQRNPTMKTQALRITLIYFVIGCLWIFLSDKLVQAIFVSRSSALVVSIAKGWFYVLATSALIYWLVYSAFKKIMISNMKMKIVNDELEQSNLLYKNLYEEFDEKQAVLKSLINSIPDLIFFKDTDGVYLGCNKAFEGFIGKTENEIVGRTDSELFDPDTAAFFRTMDIEMMTLGTTRKNEETVCYPNGDKVILETLKTPFYNHDGKVIGLIGISRDISERKKREEEIRYLNYHDILTGLYNRAFFQEELARLDTKRQLPLSIIIGDINGLKLINDALGHTEGDKLLVNMANILKKCCRAEDIVARTGGDEFWILLPQTDSQEAQQIIDRIKNTCREIAERAHVDAYYTDIALGSATKTTPEENFAKIQRIAEDFMYKRKLLESKSLHSSIISSIKTTMFEKSNETEEHAERLAEMSKSLGQALGLSENDLVALELLSTLHDIGKISVDLNILTKTEELAEEGWNEIRKHPEVGFRIAQASPELRHISEYILSHHERWDGKGYPQGLAGEDIPILSRILAVVDSYDAMTQDRAYRKAMTREAAIIELEKNAGTQFDPAIIKSFIDIINNPSLPK